MSHFLSMIPRLSEICVFFSKLCWHEVSIMYIGKNEESLLFSLVVHNNLEKAQISQLRISLVKKSHVKISPDLKTKKMLLLSFKIVCFIVLKVTKVILILL